MSKKPIPSSTPSLLDFVAGSRQDERTDLIQATRTLAGRNNRLQLTDLHVRELLTYVDRFSKRENGIEIGVELSYDQIGKILMCERRTARTVVDRAVREFGLLVAIDTLRFNGQGPNNYRIDRDAVRRAITVVETERALGETRRAFSETNPTSSSPRPGATERHPHATERHPHATERHPTTLNNTLLNSLQEETTTTVSAPLALVRVQRPLKPAFDTRTYSEEWNVVVVSLSESGVARVDLAIDGAQKLGFSPSHCMGLIRQFRELPEAERIPGTLYNWLTKARSAPTTKISKPKPKPKINRQLIRHEIFIADPARWRAASNAEMESAIESVIAQRYSDSAESP